MPGEKTKRHTAEFRAEIAQRMLAGENVAALGKRYQLARSMMYRWRDAYRTSGLAGVSRRPGRPTRETQASLTAAITGGAGLDPHQESNATEQQLKKRIAELERKIGQQAMAIDFFKGVFKRLEALPKPPASGGEASTPKSKE